MNEEKSFSNSFLVWILIIIIFFIIFCNNNKENFVIKNNNNGISWPFYDKTLPFFRRYDKY